jgi:dolichyl-phosphate-mannose--protein O-mannosyl transferase
MNILFRILKSILLTIIMFFSLRYLGVSYGTAAIVSLIPLVLGSANVLASFGFIVSGLVFIVACGSSLLPEFHFDSKEIVHLPQSAKDMVKLAKPNSSLLP